MIREKITVKNEVGLHVRVAVEFTKVANRFDSEVRLCKDGTWINGKSIVSVLTLGISRNNQVILEVKGKDEVPCFKALKAILQTEKL
jgi:phosphocarrier protein|uniref:HPr family phosphocarrier protein n=1 Tax=candidate division WOR-3 bacterium TaxID=2052148 RepID=A0A7C3URG9_UNCW3